MSEPDVMGEIDRLEEDGRVCMFRGCKCASCDAIRALARIAREQVKRADDNWSAYIGEKQANDANLRGLTERAEKAEGECKRLRVKLQRALELLTQSGVIHGI